MDAPLHPFAHAALEVVAHKLEMPVDRFAVGIPPKPEMGDFAVGCFPAAKHHGTSPAKLAGEVAKDFQANEYLSAAAAAGPFVNFHANRTRMYEYVLREDAETTGSHLVSRAPGNGKTICIDYSSPNISKHLGYHHIRSTVIGHALVNLYRALGFRVVGINHLGDWGTTHGMLLAAFHMWGAPEPITITALNELYVRFRETMKSDPAVEEQGRAWFKRLEDGEQEARALWQRFRDVSLAEFQEVYDLLGVTFDEVRGESDYVDAMPAVLKLLADKNLSQTSDGALVVPLDELDVPPLLLRKQDGATLYATRDLAAALYRHDTYAFERSLYVVGRGQSLHFKQLFAVLAKAGFDWSRSCMHVPFGLVRIGGKKAGTRSGNVVLLKEVLAEASERSRTRILERPENASLPPEELESTARKVGIGAVVFANLAAQRDKDVDFDWDDILSTDGDSGPYIQYAHARCCKLLAKGAQLGSTPQTTCNAQLLTQPAEWTLTLKLIEFGQQVFRSADTNEPHHLSRYLLDVCALFSRWYTLGNQDPSLRVLCEDRETRDARLTLAATTKGVLRTGLELLGLHAPSSM